jgi:streptogramin lyase
MVPASPPPAHRWKPPFAGWARAVERPRPWFTESDGKIGRITTAGLITEFPTPTINSFPICFVAGPDGALWFTESSGDKIGRITELAMCR